MIHKISARKFRLKTLKTCNFKFNSAEPCSKIFDPSLSGEFAPWTELDIESAINITWVSSGSEILGWTFGSYFFSSLFTNSFFKRMLHNILNCKNMYEVYPILWRILNLQDSSRELCYPQNALFTWKTYSMWRLRPSS